MQVALTYTPQLRPGLTARRVLNEDLVLAASWPATRDDIASRYVFVDWGPEFVHAHALELPELTNPGLTLSLGAMAADYIVNRRAAAYLPARYIKRHLDAGSLHLVADAPVFPYPVWSLWRDDLDPDLQDTAQKTLDTIRKQIDADHDAVMTELAEISHTDSVEILGEHEAVNHRG